MALVQADAAWAGYTAAAKTLIGKIRTSETDTCQVGSNTLNVLRPGDKFGGCSDTNPGNTGKVNPSYFAPGYYRVFAPRRHRQRRLLDQARRRFVHAARAVSGNHGRPRARVGLRQRHHRRQPVRLQRLPHALAHRRRLPVVLHARGAHVPAGHRRLRRLERRRRERSFDKNSAFIGAFALSAMPLGQTKLDAYVASWLGAHVLRHALLPGDAAPPVSARRRRPVRAARRSNRRPDRLLSRAKRDAQPGLAGELDAGPATNQPPTNGSLASRNAVSRSIQSAPPSAATTCAIASKPTRVSTIAPAISRRPAARARRPSSSAASGPPSLTSLRFTPCAARAFSDAIEIGGAAERLVGDHRYRRARRDLGHARPDRRMRRAARSIRRSARRRARRPAGRARRRR